MGDADYIEIDADERADRAYAWNGHDTEGSPRKLKHYSAARITTERKKFTDEVVEGVLAKKTLVVVYGESNSGKTFLALDMAAAVAEGIKWHGRNVTRGLVLYLATEAPGSVEDRLRAYKIETGRRLDNLIVVPTPINLYESNADTTALLALIEQIESEHGENVVLIIGDTLARMTAGANENSGEDMGEVLRNAQSVLGATNATFLLIHHTGKDTAKGMRGWSGMKAAIDTEIEVTCIDATGERSAEITKQRDLGTKGDLIGFRLQVVDIGENTWGTPRTSCVVLSADAPAKVTKAKRQGPVEGAVLEFLAARKTGIKKAEVVKHFQGRYERGPVYRAIKALFNAGAVHEAAGMVSIAEVAK